MTQQPDFPLLGEVLPPTRKPKFKVRKPGWSPQSWMITAFCSVILFLPFVIAIARRMLLKVS